MSDGVLDELRKEFAEFGWGPYNPFAVINRFEEAHPGLVDLTIHCGNCGSMPTAAQAGWEEVQRLADEDRRAWTCPECKPVKP